MLQLNYLFCVIIFFFDIVLYYLCFSFASTNQADHEKKTKNKNYLKKKMYIYKYRKITENF